MSVIATTFKYLVQLLKNLEFTLVPSLVFSKNDFYICFSIHQNRSLDDARCWVTFWIRFTSKRFWKIHCVGHTQVVWGQAPQLWAAKSLKTGCGAWSQARAQIMHLHKSPNYSRSETVYVNHWEPVEESYQLDSYHAEGRIFSCIEYWPTLFYNMVCMSNTAFISASFFIFSLQPQIWPICLTGMTEFPTTVPSDHAIELHVLFVQWNPALRPPR